MPVPVKVTTVFCIVKFNGQFLVHILIFSVIFIRADQSLLPETLLAYMTLVFFLGL